MTREFSKRKEKETITDKHFLGKKLEMINLNYEE